MECAGWNFVLGRWDFILVGGIFFSQAGVGWKFFFFW